MQRRKMDRLQLQELRRPRPGLLAASKPPTRRTPQPRTDVQRLRGRHARWPEPLFVGGAIAA
eukprot:489088-Lingulodinium_polyedra.AAC.1